MTCNFYTNNSNWNQFNNQNWIQSYNQNFYQDNNQNNNLNICDYLMDMIKQMYCLGIPNNLNYNYQDLMNMPFDNQLIIINEIQNIKNE